MLCNRAISLIRIPIPLLLTTLCRSLHNNQILGFIPSELGNLTQLTFLSLYDNDISGTIPGELGYNEGMQGMYLDGNRLSGTLPSSWIELSLSNTYLEVHGPQPACVIESSRSPTTGYSIESSAGGTIKELGKVLCGAGFTGVPDLSCQNIRNMDVIVFEHCTACPTGKSKSVVGDSDCESCPIGFYTDEWGQASCKRCDVQEGASAFHSTAAEGSSECDTCLETHYRTGPHPNGPRYKCVECNVNQCEDGSEDCMVCKASGVSLTNMHLSLGYWRTGPDSDQVERCPMGEAACLGGQAGVAAAVGTKSQELGVADLDGPTACNVGYTGAVCVPHHQYPLLHCHATHHTNPPNCPPTHVNPTRKIP